MNSARAGKIVDVFFFFFYKFIYSFCLLVVVVIPQMERVIQRERIRILPCLVHYHQSPYRTVNFVHRQIVQHQIVMNIDATMLTSMILTFDNCILKAFDFRALQIELSVCVCACASVHLISCWLYPMCQALFCLCEQLFFWCAPFFHRWHSLFVRFHG